MSYRNKVKKNIPKVELHSIMSLVVGTYKAGKTRLWKEVIELHYPNEPNAALLIAFEPGYETWELENVIPILEEGSNDDEWKVWESFKKEIVPGLIEEAKKERVVKLIGIDTADRCIDAATSWIINSLSKKYAKKFASLQEISDNTPENGWTLLYNEMKRQFDALRNAGYGIMALAWTKEKETTLYDGKKYNSVELMMHNTGRKVFESQSSFICCLFNEVRILDREGNELEENITNKRGKEVGTKFHETEPYMYFRPSQYVSIAGGRYTNLPEKTPYSAENYLKVFEEAVKGQLSKTKESISQLKDKEQQEKEDKIKDVKEEIQEQEKVTEEVFENTQEATEKTVEERIADIVELIRVEAHKKVDELGVSTKDVAKVLTDRKLKFDTIEEAEKNLELVKNFTK